MQVSIETTGGLERRLTVGVPSARIESEVTKRLQKAMPNVRIDGFRPGKVPMRVVKQRYGDGVRQEVAGEVMSQTFYEAVEQENLRPAGAPNIEPKSLQEGRDFQYVATFEVFPEFEISDLSGTAIEQVVAEVKDSDVDEMVETLRKQQGTWPDVDEAAIDGDRVNVDYKGTRDGEEFDGGTAEGSDLILGSKRMIDGFEDGLIGSKAGDTKTLSLSFPDDYHSEDLQGAAVEFSVTVNKVSRMELAEMNDEFFEKLGVKEGGEDGFRDELRANMERELKNAIQAKLKNQVMESLLENHDIQVPHVLVKNEIDALRTQSLQQFGGDMGQFDASLLPDELFSEQAERRVKLGLVMGEIIRQQDLKPDADKVKETIEEMASSYENPEEVVQWYYGNQQQLASVEGATLEQQVVDQLLGQMSVAEKAMDYKEAVQPEG
ncbi:MAG: trigger factor [Pseudomonadales bacterium]